jgi:tetratricopeptide (TPR) repeat protein
MAIPRYFTQSQTLRLVGLQLGITLFIVGIASDTAWLVLESGVIFAGTALAHFGWPRIERWLLAHCSENATFWQAREHLRAGRTEAAGRGFAEFAATHPEDPTPLLWQAIALERQHKYWDAIESLDRSIAVRPLGYVYARRGAIRVNLGDVDGALLDLRMAILLEADPYYSKAIMAFALLRARRTSEAVQILEPMRETRPDLIVTAYLAEAYRLERRHADEAKVLAEILRAKGTNSHGWEPGWVIAQRALALVHLRRFNEAKDVLRIALRKHPHDVHILGALADWQNATGDRDALCNTLTILATRIPTGAAYLLMHPDFTPNLTEERFRRLLAWALGAQRAAGVRLRRTSPEAVG